MDSLPRITIPTQQELDCPSRGTWHKRNSSTAGTDNHRWSEIVPPESALSFSIVWDPAGEVAMFSNAELLGPCRNSNSLASPVDVSESQSQVVTIEPSSNPIAENTPTLAMFTERHESLFPARSPLFERQMRVGRARRSSTFGGLDIYLRGSITGPVPRVQYYTPKDDAGAENQFGSLTSFVRLCLEYAEGAVEIADTVAGERHFMSMISVSTNVPSTAPSDYLTVRAYPDSDASSTWSELDPPETPTYPHPMRPQPVQQNNRRLRKSKPSEEPLPPSEVLERELYNHMTEPRLNTWRQYRLPNIANSIRKWTRPNGSQGASDAWVWIELSQEITEHYLN